MTASQLRHHPVPEVGTVFLVDGQEGRHGANALRLRAGETVLVSDGDGTVADCRVVSTGKGEVELEVVERVVHPRPRPQVIVVQALPKSERSELAVELATEAGADEIWPWQSERCISRWTGAKGKGDKGRTKWQNAARAAAKQSRRAFEPHIGDLLEKDALVQRVRSWVAGGSVVIVLHEQSRQPFADLVRGAVQTGAEAIVVVVGPEGGVSEAEAAALRDAGAHTALLGREVLRTSTAAAVALGAIGVLTARWQPAAID